jgi:D-alanine-D-alanine ligase-like ATP-grasp enzyme
VLVGNVLCVQVLVLGGLDGGGLLGSEGTVVVLLKSLRAGRVGVGKGTAVAVATTIRSVVVVAITGLSLPLVVTGRAAIASIGRTTITWEK